MELFSMKTHLQREFDKCYQVELLWFRECEFVIYFSVIYQNYKVDKILTLCTHNDIINIIRKLTKTQFIYVLKLQLLVVLW
jgi:hypothetical protein